MYANCLIVALAFRATHTNCKLKATIRGKGQNGLFPHFYVILNDSVRIDFRAKYPPLSKLNQLLFDGHLVYKKLKH